MNKQFFRSLYFIVSVLVFGLNSSCNEEDPALADNLITFEATSLGIEETESQAVITINLSRAISKPTTIEISYTESGVVYGEDYTTNPSADNGIITLNIPAKETSVSFTVTRSAEIFLNGDEFVTFEITSIESTTDIIVGETGEIKLLFSAIVSEGSTLTLQGKTEASHYANSVFTDLSGNVQIPILRKKWALGFYTGNDFKTILNHSFQMLAASSTKTDLNAVTTEDAQATLLYQFNAFTPSVDGSALSLADSWDGDLSKTAIANVSATDSENKVHFVVTENSDLNDPSTWYKVRVLRKNDGYTLQYAKVPATTFQSIDIEKNDQYNFVFVSLDNGADGQIVNVEPVKSNWDIEWSYSTSLSSPSFNTPYWFQDFILINYKAGVEAAEVVSASAEASAQAYTNFNESSLATVTFLNTRDAIGAKWRSTAPPTPTGIKRDRFYVIKDALGNVYKLKFITMGVNDEGERGRPVIEYKLVKKAS